MPANDIQHGGDHYKQDNYEHWDFVCDAGLDYLLGTATKYAARWRRKNGVEDLKKCGHYIQKAMERGVVPPYVGNTLGPLFQFTRNRSAEDSLLLGKIVLGDYEGALCTVGQLIAVDGLETPNQEPQG